MYFLQPLFSVVKIAEMQHCDNIAKRQSPRRDANNMCKLHQILKSHQTSYVL